MDHPFTREAFVLIDGPVAKRWACRPWEGGYAVPLHRRRAAPQTFLAPSPMTRLPGDTGAEAGLEITTPSFLRVAESCRMAYQPRQD